MQQRVRCMARVDRRQASAYKARVRILLMFQTFEDTSDPSKVKTRVAQLRKALRARKLAAFLVPRADEHQNEYVPACAERLSWLTGFTGSAGLAVVARESAALFVDGRYTLQAPEQVDTRIFEILRVPQNKSSDWVKAHLKKGDALGYDPRLHSVKAIRKMEEAVCEAGAVLAPQEDNPVDAIWEDRPPPPVTPVVLHPLEFAGEPASRKIARVRKTLRKNKAAAVILTMPESIAWLVNIRGRDVPHTPLALCFAILPAKGRPELFIASKKLTPDVRKVLEQDVALRKPDDLPAALAALGKAKSRVLLDPETASRWFADRLDEAGAQIIHGADPCLALKARKNRTEIAGTRTAHRRDGVAMCRFLAWLDARAPSGTLDEIGVTKKLEGFRRQTGALKEISFDTISGAGANGAIVHYRVSEATNAVLEPGTLYLVDSGAQY
ncbi:MAG TPA: M24 family metallopeptidase, partial [Rhizobiales bacterium]|nr:M24 family metallopeptidase [Hyphomicrobiales bacterium]